MTKTKLPKEKEDCGDCRYFQRSKIACNAPLGEPCPKENQTPQEWEERLEKLALKKMWEFVKGGGNFKKSHLLFVGDAKRWIYFLIANTLKDFIRQLLSRQTSQKNKKPQINFVANIVNNLFLDSDYLGKDWEAVRLNLIKQFSSLFVRQAHTCWICKEKIELGTTYGCLHPSCLYLYTKNTEVDKLLKEQAQKIRKEIIGKIEKMDTLPCLCQKNPFDKLCEYNKGWQRALEEIKKIIQ